jgi:hypothetical protein
LSKLNGAGTRSSMPQKGWTDRSDVLQMAFDKAVGLLERTHDRNSARTTSNPWSVGGAARKEL